MSTTIKLGPLLLALQLGVSALATGALAHETQRKTELFNPGVGVADQEARSLRASAAPPCCSRVWETAVSRSPPQVPRLRRGSTRA